MNTNAFYSALENAIAFITDGLTFLRDFYNCLPHVAQLALYAFFVVVFGFAFIRVIVGHLR